MTNRQQRRAALRGPATPAAPRGKALPSIISDELSEDIARINLEAQLAQKEIAEANEVMTRAQARARAVELAHQFVQSVLKDQFGLQDGDVVKPNGRIVRNPNRPSPIHAVDPDEEESEEPEEENLFELPSGPKHAQK